METPTLHVIDAYGEEYMAQAVTEHSDELNSDKTLSITFEENELNSQFIGKLDETYRISGVEGAADKKKWRVTLHRMTTSMNKRYLIVHARRDFIDYMDNDRIYERYDRSFTAVEFFTMLFAGTPFTFNLIDSFSSVSWEGLCDGESRLNTLQRGLERYKSEFELIGDQVNLHAQIKREQPYMLHRQLNASNIQRETDATEFWTYCRGYGDYEDGADEGGGVEEKANLKREYISPLAAIPGIGRRHAPPVKNGKITVPETLEQAIEDLCEQSVKVSLTLDWIKMNDYPYDNPENGDLVPVIDPVIDYEIDTRIVKIITTRNAVGEITGRKITVGGQNIDQRHRSALNAAAKLFSDLDKGRTTLPFSFMPAAHQLATTLLLNARTEIDFTVQGLVATDKNNPNLVVLLNSAGLGISDDGGQTFKDAFTGAGLVADVITSGTLNTHLARIAGTEGVFLIDGDELLSVDINDPDKFVRISPGQVYIKGGGLTVERPDKYALIINGMMNLEYNVQFTATPWISPNVEQAGYNLKTIVTDAQDIASGRFRRDGRYLKVVVGQRVAESGETCIIRIESTGATREIYVTSTETTTSLDWRDQERVLTVDFGVPDGSQQNFYVTIQSGNGTEVYGRVISAWIEG